MRKIEKIIIPFLMLVVFLLNLFHVGYRLEGEFADAIYQQGGLPSGRVFLIEIDEHSFEELGPYQTWTRDYVAQAIETLNADGEKCPAAIGVDVLYIGYSYEDADAHLLQACFLEDNVVLGSLLNYDTMLVTDADGSVHMEEGISLYEEPFKEVAMITTQGFVNGYPDKDGIIRHAKLKQQIPDGREIPSFDYMVYQTYLRRNGQKEQGVLPKVDNDAFWYLNYQGVPGAYSNRYSLSDLIQGEIDPARFANSIVLIGPYAEGMMDSHYTAADHSVPMYGLEVHANTIDTMLQADYKTELPLLLQAIMAALAVLVAYLVCRQAKLRYSILCAVVGCLGYPLLAYGIYQKGIVLPILYIPIISFLVPVCNVGVHYLRTLSQKRLVEKTFKRYVDPEIVNKIMKTGLDQIQLGGQSREIACLFVDIRGFTTMSELLTPEEVVEILNRYLELTSSCIFRHQGTLDKFIGDATMAIFNAPLEQDDYIMRAVMAANDMVEGAQALGKELQEKFGRSVNFGIGVHCGPAVVGNIGTQRRMDYTAIGDTVNTAARLEANAPGGSVLISRNVYEALSGRIEAESLGELPLKGKSERLEIFKLTRISGK